MMDGTIVLWNQTMGIIYYVNTPRKSTGYGCVLHPCLVSISIYNNFVSYKLIVRYIVGPQPAPFSSLYLSGHLKFIQEKVHWSQILQAEGPGDLHDMRNASNKKRWGKSQVIKFSLGKMYKSWDGRGERIKGSGRIYTPDSQFQLSVADGVAIHAGITTERHLY